MYRKLKELENYSEKEIDLIEDLLTWDAFYEYSDDSNVWKNGSRYSEKLTRFANDLLAEKTLEYRFDFISNVCNIITNNFKNEILNANVNNIKDLIFQIEDNCSSSLKPLQNLCFESFISYKNNIKMNIKNSIINVLISRKNDL